MIAIIISIIIIISTFSNSINKSFIYPVDNIDLGYLELQPSLRKW